MSVHKRREALKESRSFRLSQQLSRYLDDYYLDGMMGLFPVVGDSVGLGFHAVYLYVSAVKLRSWRLTLVILFNALKDMLIGMIPVLGMVFDFFYKSNKRNFALIEGFADGNAEIIRQVNKQAGMAAVGLLLLGAAAYWLAKLAWAATAYLWQAAAGLW